MATAYPEYTREQEQSDRERLLTIHLGQIKRTAKWVRGDAEVLLEAVLRLANLPSFDTEAESFVQEAESALKEATRKVQQARAKMATLSRTEKA